MHKISKSIGCVNNISSADRIDVHTVLCLHLSHIPCWMEIPLSRVPIFEGIQIVAKQHTDFLITHPFKDDGKNKLKKENPSQCDSIFPVM